MRLCALTPMLQAPDIAATAAWYRDVLGFERTSEPRDDWARLERDDVAIMLMNNAHFDGPSATAVQCILVDDVMALWARIESKVTAEWGPAEMPYGMIEFAIRDFNGYLLSFAQPTGED